MQKLWQTSPLRGKRSQPPKTSPSNSLTRAGTSKFPLIQKKCVFGLISALNGSWQGQTRHGAFTNARAMNTPSNSTVAKALCPRICVESVQFIGTQSRERRLASLGQLKTLNPRARLRSLTPSCDAFSMNGTASICVSPDLAAASVKASGIDSRSCNPCFSPSFLEGHWLEPSHIHLLNACCPLRSFGSRTSKAEAMSCPTCLQASEQFFQC